MNVFAGDTVNTPALVKQPASELDTKKAEAKDAINALENLTPEEKNSFTDRIDKASKVEEIQPIVDKANAKAAENKKALDEAKDKAKTEVGKLANLSDEENKDFTDRIDAVTKIEEIKPIVEEAKAKDKTNEAAKNEYDITIVPSENGTVTAKVGDTENAEKAKKDEVVTLTIDPKTGYKLKELKVMSGDKEVEVKDNKFKMPAAKVTVKATFDEDKKPDDKSDTKPTKYNITVKSIGNGYADADAKESVAGKTITVTAKPYSGYAVARVYLKYAGITKNINTYYNGYYYDGRYYGRYNDYYKYLNKYENNSYYLRKYDSYREFLRHEYPRHYRYYEDYDYWTDRYDYDWYDRYDNYYYKYLDDYNRYYSDRYATYEDYLKVYHYPHYRDYYDYRYDYRYHNYRYGYNTSDTFEMPASDVTVYVEFTDAYPYYYDDYYYYRARRDKKAEEAKAKAEAAKKEEEEAKAKAEAAKQPQIYENKAVISIGSNVLDKVSKNVHTVHQMDAPAYVNNGRVMLPLRYVAEALGLQVSWVPETKTVIIWDLTQRVEIPVKSNRIIVNGITYTSDVKPEIKSGRTMLPIANIARALGLIDGSDIVWDQYNKQVTLTRKVLSK